ncbi:MAG TPA: glycosyltransferase [Spirochaetia bacterium]|nr:glycosyltransferase [Spirochaetia bacterium]
MNNPEKAPGSDSPKIISIVMPVYNGARYLDQVLTRIQTSAFKNYELIVIDDCSTDRTGEIVKHFPVDRYIRNEKRMDAGSCRNTGAGLAQGDILLFMDSDILLAEDTLGRIASFFERNDSSALIGLYSLEHPSSRTASRYKNTWIRHSYLAAPNPVSWFFTSVGAVRKRDWELTGGFDADLSSRSGGEDIELGWRLIRRGIRIFLDRGLEVVHLKSYDLSRLLKNDFLRAYGFGRLALGRGRRPKTLIRQGMANIPGNFALASLLAAFLVLLGGLAAAYPALLPLLLLLFFLYWALSGSFLRYVKKKLSVSRLLAFIPILFLDHLFCFTGMFAALLSHLIRREQIDGKHPPKPKSNVD